MGRHLTSKEETRIHRCVLDRIQHFSPTISPAPKNVERNEIESILEAISYYRSKGISKLILEPKFMGSYCDLYLYRDIEKSRFFSRNAYSIAPRLLSKEILVEAARPIWEKFQEYWDDGATLILVQAELMPWSALGKGLIVRDFKGYEVCHQTHADYLKNSELRSAIGGLARSEDFKKYLADAAILTSKELAQKYPQHIVRQYEALRFLTLPNPTTYQNAIDLYRQQLERYGAEGPICFQPFNWLKMVFEDHSEVYNENNIFGYEQVSNQPHLVLDLTTRSEDDPFEDAYDFFHGLVNQGMEGIVIKPQQVWNPEVVPMFKVRNNNYLQLIYGVRFQDDYDYYLGRRKVGSKMKCSMNEWNIAQSLLRIPMHQISKENQDYYSLIEKRILEEDFEVGLDKRL